MKLEGLGAEGRWRKKVESMEGRGVKEFNWTDRQRWDIVEISPIVEKAARLVRPRLP
jgi:hypothetical protein